MTGSRPMFRDILESMLKDDKELLSIPKEDASISPQATQLGAPLEASKLMYLPLQHVYLSEPQTNKRETIYEAIESFSVENSLPKIPLTLQSSITTTPPPLPSTPKPKAKPPLAQKSSNLSIGGSHSSSGTPTYSKPPLQQKPSNMSIDSRTSSHPNPPVPLRKPPLTGKLSMGSITNGRPMYGNVEDDDYDDIEQMTLGTPYTSSAHDQEDIYDDIADPSQINNPPNASIYEIPVDTKDDPCDVDYEDI